MTIPEEYNTEYLLCEAVTRKDIEKVFYYKMLLKHCPRTKPVGRKPIYKVVSL